MAAGVALLAPLAGVGASAATSSALAAARGGPVPPPPYATAVVACRPVRAAPPRCVTWFARHVAAAFGDGRARGVYRTTTWGRARLLLRGTPRALSRPLYVIRLTGRFRAAGASRPTPSHHVIQFSVDRSTGRIVAWGGLAVRVARLGRPRPI